MSPDRLAYMANQIGCFFAHQPFEKAIASTADHLKKFWDPRMRAAIFAHIEKGGAGLEPIALAAVRALKAQVESLEA